MLLDDLQKFEWYNEPENVVFHENELCVTARPETDFWQGKQHGFGRDSGHFFFARRDDEFTFIAQWRFENLRPYEQCGIMLRVDENNWIKASILYDNPQCPMIGTSVTQNGCSDWAAQEIPEKMTSVWFKMKRTKGDYSVYYSPDGKNYKQIRLTHLLNDMPEVKIGAYLCSPAPQSFEASLSQLEFM